MEKIIEILMRNRAREKEKSILETISIKYTPDDRYLFYYQEVYLLVSKEYKLNNEFSSMITIDNEIFEYINKIICEWPQKENLDKGIEIYKLGNNINGKSKLMRLIEVKKKNKKK